MIEDYVILAGRIRQELAELERVVSRAERAMTAARQHPEDQDLYLDSAALNLHDFYTGLERLFQQIATTVDRSLPSGRSWHRDLLQQMGVDLPDLRPPVLSSEAIEALDEYLRFRHVVRNIYTFLFNLDQLERLVKQARPVFTQAETELLTFAQFLEQVGRE